jgi:hypothetical protein
MTDVMYDDAIIDYVDDPASADDVFTTGGGSGLGRLEKILAQRELSGVLTESKLTTIGMEVVRDWQQDRDENKDWRDQVQKALDAASQEPAEPKTFPWRGAANVKYPLLSIATQQFSARAYPALVKGDEAILVKTFGADPQGMKKARAKRVADYLNFVLFYKVEDWEGDTDSLLNQLPSTGTCFRKVYYDALEQKYCIRLVPALRLTVPIGAKTLETSPRITEDFDQFPNDIARMKKAGLYRDVVLVDAAKTSSPSSAGSPTSNTPSYVIRRAGSTRSALATCWARSWRWSTRSSTRALTPAQLRRREAGSLRLNCGCRARGRTVACCSSPASTRPPTPQARP